MELTCSGCKQKLSVPDSAAGKNAKCPKCSTVISIPSAAAPAASPAQENPFAGMAGPSAPASGPLNPYASPAAASGGFGSPAAVGAGELSVQTIDAGQALSIAWDFFKRNAGLLIGAFLLQMVIFYTVYFGIMIAAGVAGAAIGDPENPVAAIFGFVGGLAAQVLQLWMTLGLFRINLACVREQPRSVGMLFSGGPYVLRYIGATILFVIAFYIGLFLLIIPGIYIALTYWAFPMFIVDRNCGVFESFSLAGKHASGNRLNAFLLGIIAVGLSLATIVTLFLGLIVVAPLIGLMFVVAYMMMTGQPMAYRQ